MYETSTRSNQRLYREASPPLIPYAPRLDARETRANKVRGLPLSSCFARTAPRPKSRRWAEAELGIYGVSGTLK